MGLVAEGAHIALRTPATLGFMALCAFAVVTRLGTPRSPPTRLPSTTSRRFLARTKPLRMLRPPAQTPSRVKTLRW